MLTDDEIDELFRDKETDRAERKASFAHVKEDVLKAICAFANDLPNSGKPGVIFLGQHDNLTCANLAIDDDLLRQLGGMRSDGKILPPPVMTVRARTIDGCEVAYAIVAPSEQPPVRVDGRTWIRVGPRRAIATIEEERRLAEKQRWRNMPFDRQPCAGTTPDDLDLKRFESEYVPSATSPEAYREDGRSTMDKLRALRLATPDGSPTNGAVLLYGLDPRQSFPGAYVQFLRIEGTALTDPVRSHKEIWGPLPDQVRQVEELIRLNVNTSATIGSTRVEQSDYPIAALEQLVRNALIHRNYEATSTPVKVYWFDDRVEIHNPGGLFGTVTPETIWQNVTDYRNPSIAEAMKILGLVDRFGFGMVKANSSLADNGNPPLEFDFQPNFVLFTVRAAQ